MFNTIKAKILFLTFTMLILMSIVLGIFSFLAFKDGTKLLIRGCDFTISSFSKTIQQQVSDIENNAYDLAVMGELYQRGEKKDSLAKYFVSIVFKNYTSALGGGIWFKPYAFDKSKKLKCFYAYRNKENKIVLDESFESESYDYPNQIWYKQIVPKLNLEHDIAWSMPYYENQGSETIMVTAGSGIYDEDRNLIGLSTVDWEIGSIVKTIRDMHPTKNSIALFADKNNDYIIVSTDLNLNNPELMGRSLKEIPWYSDKLVDMESFEYLGKKYISYVKPLKNGMIFIVNVPENELFGYIIKHIAIMFLMLVIISVSVSFVFYLVLQANIAYPIKKLINIANKISTGELNEQITIERPQEFVKLAQTFNKMTNDIQNITKEREKIDSELQIAKAIQEQSLPNIFPPFPERSEFDIFASMDAAKEVGGDFYDFYFIDSDNFMFLVADVSGKGVPAALFMMTTKTLINNMSQYETNRETLVEQVNRKICESNKHGLFVTLLAGIVNIKNGKLTLINCGHNPPLIRRSGGKFEYLELDSNMVLGIFPDFKFKIFETKIKPQDKIFIYTDGVTEAQNEQDEFFGEERLKNALNRYSNQNIQEISKQIKKDVDDFRGNAQQSDDITMLAFEYRGADFKTPEIKAYRNKANRENYADFNSWLLGNCKGWNLNSKIISRVELCAEEIYTNIFSYAYSEFEGDFETILEYRENNSLILKFIDLGMPYNPLDKIDPDIDLPDSERSIGGLGIYMVKQSCDEIEYENLEGKNILTLTFEV